MDPTLCLRFLATCLPDAVHISAVPLLGIKFALASVFLLLKSKVDQDMRKKVVRILFALFTTLQKRKSMTEKHTDLNQGIQCQVLECIFSALSQQCFELEEEHLQAIFHCLDAQRYSANIIDVATSVLYRVCANADESGFDSLARKTLSHITVMDHLYALCNYDESPTKNIAYKSLRIPEILHQG